MNIENTLREIRNHKCPHKVISSNCNPRQLEIGFSCVCGQKWIFHLMDVKRNPAYCKKLETVQKRIDLAAFLTRSNCITLMDERRI